MTDILQWTSKQKQIYDLSFAYEMAEQAIDTQDYDQSLQICQRAILKAKEQGSHSWIPLFEDLMAKITVLIESSLEPKKNTSKNTISQTNSEKVDDFTVLSGVGPSVAQKLREGGYKSIEQLSKIPANKLSEIKGIGLTSAQKIIDSAQEHCHIELNKHQETFENKVSAEENIDDFKIDLSKSFVEIEQSTKSERNGCFNARELFMTDVKTPETVIENTSHIEIAKNSNNIMEPSFQSSPKLETLQTNESTHKQFSIISLIHSILDQKGYILLPKEPSLSNYFKDIDEIACKIIDISHSKRLLLIIPLNVFNSKNRLNVSEKEIHLQPTKQDDGSEEGFSSLLISSLLRISNILFDGIITENNLREIMSLNLSKKLTIQRISLKRPPVLMLETITTGVCIEPLLLVKETPGFKEKTISYAYQRKNNLHIIAIDDLEHYISFLEKKIFYIENYALSHRETANLELLRSNFNRIIRCFSYPIIGFGLIFGFILVSRFYELLKYCLTIGYASGLFYIGGLFFLYLKFQKDMANTTNQFAKSINYESSAFDDGDLTFIKEELSENEMAQFSYECFGKDIPYKILEDVEIQQLEHLKVPKSASVEIEELKKPSSPNDPFKAQKPIIKKGDQLIQKYSKFLED